MNIKCSQNISIFLYAKHTVCVIFTMLISNTEFWALKQTSSNQILAPLYFIKCLDLFASHFYIWTVLVLHI